MKRKFIFSAAFIAATLFSPLGEGNGGSLFAQNVGINTTGAAAAATNFVEILQPSTTASSVGIYSLHSGAITGTGYAGYFSKTGASTTNVAGYFSATGATNNYAGIFENGSVGIGTTTPSGLLTIRGTSAGITTNIYGGGNFVDLAHLDFDGNNSASVQKTYASVRAEVGTWTSGSETGMLAFSTMRIGVLTEAMRIMNSGNVGIGTTGPNYLLDVNGVINAATGYRIANAVATTGNYLRGNGTNFVASAIVNTDLPGSFSGFANPTGTLGLTAVNGTATTAMRSDGAPALSQAIIPTWTGTHTFSNATYSALFTGGYVGMGTSTPQAGLHVALPNGAPTAVLQLGHGNQPSFEWIFDVNGSANMSIINEGSGTPLTSMFFNSNGNIGIGTTTIGTGTRLTINNNYSGISAKYGIDNTVTTDGTGTKYGISNTVNGLTANASQIWGINTNLLPNGTGIAYGLYNDIDPVGTGTRYGTYNLVEALSTNSSSIYGTYNSVVPNGTGTAYALYSYISNVGTGVRYGMYTDVNTSISSTSSTYGQYTIMDNDGTGGSYGLYITSIGSTTGTEYGLYVTGEDVNYFSAKTGMGTLTPVATLDIQVANVTTSATTVGNVHIMANGAQAINKGGSLTLGGYYDDAASIIRVFGSIEGRKYNGTTGSSTGYLAFKTNSSGTLNEVMRIDYDGQVGIGTTSPGADLHIFTPDNGIGQIIQINATSANITASDNFISFTNDAGTVIGAIEGTATSGTIAYTTFTGAHYTIIDERNGLEPNMLLEATGENFDTEQKQLVKSRICTTRQSKAAYGVYGGTNNEGKDLVLSMGTGYIWVANKGQDIEVGDYLISSDIRGCAEKQDDDLSHNYSVAKAQQPVKWNIGETKRLVACIYLGG